MQVFMPYPDLRLSVACLDSLRLRNQVLRECKTLLNGGWPNHPAAKLWRNYKYALCEYAIFGIRELSTRAGEVLYICHAQAYRDAQLCLLEKGAITAVPEFIHDYRLNTSHREALLAKGMMDATFTWYKDALKHGRLTKKAELPKLKSKWTTKHYVWCWFNLYHPTIESTYYGQFGWDCEPRYPDEHGKWNYYWPEEAST